jgi:hypothetical protein
MNNVDDSMFDPQDDSVEDDYERKQLVRNILSGYRPQATAKIIVLQPPKKSQPGLHYFNYSENPANEGHHWVPSTELFAVENKFALLNAGSVTPKWGLKHIYPDKKSQTGFERYYHLYGGVDLPNDGVEYDDDFASVYLVRFSDSDALNEFRQSTFNIPLHHYAPVPASPFADNLFDDSDTAQMHGWREKFAGSGFSDREIMGIVNTAHDIPRMEMLFLCDQAALNLAYRYVGGKPAVDWMIYNLKKQTKEQQ